MKILSIHADFIEFEAKKKAFKGAEEGIEEGRKRVEECLVIFTAFEKRDESDTAAVLQRYMQEIKNIAQQVNAKNVVLYPYAHLSSQLGNPKQAEKFLKDAQQELSDKFAVSRAPFGWYKSFNISCKGHPLSELSREFGPDGERSDETVGTVETKTETGATKKLQRVYKDEPFTFNEEISEENKNHLTSAYLVAKVVKDMFPDAEIGSAGLHNKEAYVDLSNVKISQKEVKEIERKVKDNIGITFKTVENDESQNRDIQLNKWQKQINSDLGEKSVKYSCDSEKPFTFIPQFNDPFVDTQDLKIIKITNSASAYWKNNEKNEQLTRIYCVAFQNDEDHEKFKKAKEDAEARSHLKLGKELDLFVVSDLVGPGLPLLTANGTILRNEVIKFLWDLHKNIGYQQVNIPHIAKHDLYKKSGHWDKFGDELFHVTGKYDNFILKPMNCPHHIQIFDNKSYSYRDLPIRYFEPTTNYRDEKPGQLIGLSRVRSITQDDGHIFCRVDQIEQEVKTTVAVILEFYKTLGMEDYWVSLSVRGKEDQEYLGEKEVWNTAEEALQKVADNLKLPYKKIEGEAAFYGPKLDFMFKDALGREWQLATIQLDFNLPERFDLTYMTADSKKERLVMIHRAISGSLERFLSVMIEHYAGKFPLWLAPLQVKILTISDAHKEYANSIYKKMRKHDIRVEIDDRVESMGKKVRDAQANKVPYIITVGDKEIEKDTLAIRTRDGEVKYDVSVEDFVKKLVEEVKERK